MNSRSTGNRKPRRLACASVPIAVVAASARTFAASVPDLIESSLEELRSTELPPLSSSVQFQVSATAVAPCRIAAAGLGFPRGNP